MRHVGLLTRSVIQAKNDLVGSIYILKIQLILWTVSATRKIHESIPLYIEPKEKCHSIPYHQFITPITLHIHWQYEKPIKPPKKIKEFLIYSYLLFLATIGIFNIFIQYPGPFLLKTKRKVNKKKILLKLSEPISFHLCKFFMKFSFIFFLFFIPYNNIIYWSYMYSSFG